MTTEREMLEAAAKACGIDLECWHGELYGFEKYDGLLWNPLTDSADCAAMCAKLSIDTTWSNTVVGCELWADDIKSKAYFNDHNNDREAAWRYAATMVAAKIGGMK